MNSSHVQKQENENARAEMQNLLQQFNKVDRKKQGSIKISEAIKLVRELCSIHKMGEEITSKVIYNTEKFVTFDQFLALMFEAEQSNKLSRSNINHNMVQFLKLLEDYRKKCEEASLYLEAEKAHQKIMEVKDKEMKRHRQNLLTQQKTKVLSVNNLQQSKLLQFNSAWNEYMEKYQDAAINSIEKLKAKHLREMQEEEERIKNYLQSYLKPSKRIIDLKSKEKSLVKQKDYIQAERVKNTINQIEEKQRQSKTVEIAERIKKRKQVLQKHQEISLLAHLKRIEKDRNEQMKQRQDDSEKMLIKLKNIQNDLVQKQSVEIRQTLEGLRETMCLTSGKLFNAKHLLARKSADKLDKINNSTIEENPQPNKQKKQKNFKIRVNSFHRTKIEDSLYDP